MSLEARLLKILLLQSAHVEHLLIPIPLLATEPLWSTTILRLQGILSWSSGLLQGIHDQADAGGAPGDGCGDNHAGVARVSFYAPMKHLCYNAPHLVPKESLP